MPQASEELRAKMKARFGSSISEQGPIKFLEQAGYILDRSYRWIPKDGVLTYDDMTPHEYDCMKFLVDEWDFGGLILKKPSEQ